MKIAPVVPYDVDLKFWGEEKIEIPSSQKFDSLHRFWKTNEHVDEFVPPQLLDSYRTRKINIVTKVEKITRKCRASLPNGSLCERMDRHKCPFHGVIVPRNELGVPIDEGERKKVSCAGFLNLQILITFSCQGKTLRISENEEFCFHFLIIHFRVYHFRAQKTLRGWECKVLV